jgi:hypothetical protein
MVRDWRLGGGARPRSIDESQGVTCREEIRGPAPTSPDPFYLPHFQSSSRRLAWAEMVRSSPGGYGEPVVRPLTSIYED